jgi:hypothetical protein
MTDVDPNTTAAAREYTREEMREACRNNYNAALAEFARRLAASQEPLGEDFAKVLHDNLEALYVRS